MSVDFATLAMAESKVKIFKTLKFINLESKYYMQWLIGEHPSISTTLKSFQKSTTLLHSKPCSKLFNHSFWLPWAFKG
jgi:hypothetical protein